MILFINLFLAVLGFCCCSGFSLVAASGSYSLVAVRGLLIAVASRCRTQALGHMGSVDEAPGSRAQTL